MRISRTWGLASALAASLVAAEARAQATDDVVSPPGSDLSASGIFIPGLEAQVRDYASPHLPGGGVMIMSLSPNSPLVNAQAWVPSLNRWGRYSAEPGDIIIRLENQRVRSAQELAFSVDTILRGVYYEPRTVKFTLVDLRRGGITYDVYARL